MSLRRKNECPSTWSASRWVAIRSLIAVNSRPRSTGPTAVEEAVGEFQAQPSSCGRGWLERLDEILVPVGRVEGHHADGRRVVIDARGRLVAQDDLHIFGGQAECRALHAVQRRFTGGEDR